MKRSGHNTGYWYLSHMDEIINAYLRWRDSVTRFFTPFTHTGNSHSHQSSNYGPKNFLYVFISRKYKCKLKNMYPHFKTERYTKIWHCCIMLMIQFHLDPYNSFSWNKEVYENFDTVVQCSWFNFIQLFFLEAQYISVIVTPQKGIILTPRC